MDFEERLAGAERSDSPSLVGSSLRSADDSPHKNYIHPEKYVSSRAESRSKSRSRSTNLRLSVTASLDDLINEGALLGSEEDFDKFLDGDGTVKNEAKYTSKLDKEIDEGDEEDDTEKDDATSEDAQRKIDEAIEQDEPLRGRTAKKEAKEDPVSTGSKSNASNAASSFYKQDDYSTPNLSDYQLEQNITDHSDFVSHVQSYDLEKLPRSKLSLEEEKKACSQPRPKLQTTLSSAQQQRLESSLQPFHTDRPRSRSRSANPTSRIAARSSSSSSTTSSRHLARGDSYKNVHGDEPSKYELPPSFSNDEVKETEEEEEEDRGRAARPTLRDTIAAAEARKAQSGNDAFVPEYESNPISREPSLVTTGDYTNFDVDNPRSPVKYKPNARFIRSSSSHPLDEKNDSNVDGLMEEGALVTDDPYASIDQLDSLMEEILQGQSEPVGLEEKGEKSEPQEDEKLNLKGKGEVSEKKSSTKDKVEDVPSSSSTKGIKKVVDDGADSSNKADETPKTALKDDTKKEVNLVEAEKDDKKVDDEALSNSVGDTDEVEKGSSTKEVIEKDAKKTEAEGNEKDDADTTALKEEGALTSSDPMERVEESELREGVSSNVSTEKESTSEQSKEDNSEHLESSKKKPEDNLIQGSLNTDGPADLEKLEQEEEEGREENEIEEKEEEKGKIPKDEQAELESAEKNKPNLIVGGADEIATVAEEDSKDDKATEITKDAASKKEVPEAAEPVSKDIESSKSKEEVAEGELEEQSEKSKDEIKAAEKELDSSKQLLEGTLNADGPEELKEEEAEATEKNADELDAKKDVEDIEPKEATETEEKPLKSVGESKAKNEAAASKEEEPADESSKAVEEEIEPTAEAGKGDPSADATSSEVAREADTSATSGASVAEAITADEGTTKDVKPSKDIEVAAAKAEPDNETAEKTPAEVATESTSTKPRNETSTTDEFDDLEDISPEEIRKHLESQPIYIFTSLAGGAQIIPRTNRLATILQANGVKFEYRDLGTDEEAKKIWRRQANGKTLPGVVRGDDYVGNWQEIDEANEEYQVKDLLYSF